MTVLAMSHGELSRFDTLMRAGADLEQSRSSRVLATRAKLSYISG